MNQYSQYLMWVKNKYIRNSHFRASMINPFNNSWEERAFAEDASGALGGFVWPPRSYSCSFCKREFRSAQALGGHMNIHRKDRARLKQSLTPQTEGFHHQNQNQNHKHHHDYKSLGDHHSYPSQERLMELRRYSSPASRSDSKGFGLFNVSDFKSASEVRKEGTFAFPGGQNENCVETSLSIGLDLADSQNRPYGSDFDEVILTSKRHKTTVSSVPFFLEQCSKDRYSLEKLDLELRLGDPPKVK